MTTRKLKRVVDRYSKMLGLSDWDIDVSFADQNTLGGRNGQFIYGDVRADEPLDARTATMRIARERDLGPYAERIIRETVGHELGHLRFDPTERIAADTAFEAGLDALGRLLADIDDGEFV